MRGLQFKRLNLLLVLSENFGRQTDGRGFVISSRAVTKMYFHVTTVGAHGGGKQPSPEPLLQKGNSISGYRGWERGRKGGPALLSLVCP